MRHLLAFSPLLLLLLLLPGGGTQCFLTDGGTTYYLVTDDRPPEDVAAQLGLTLAPADRLTELPHGGARRLVLERQQTVTVVTPQEQLTVQTYQESVGDLLSQLGIEYGGQVRLACDPALPTFDGMTVELLRVQERQEQRRETVPAGTLLLESAALQAGQTEVLCEGADGVLLHSERITEENGRQTDRTALGTMLLEAPRTRIVLYGVDRSISVRPTDAPQGGVVAASSGELLRYRYILQCEATAYSCEGYVGTTATGSTARVGAIAVDPRYIPYGTRMYIVSNDGQYVYGYATAEDTGAFSGYRIDLYFDTVDECWQFGRRACTVYILD